MPTETETPAVDWREQAEAAGRAAFEAATAEPPTPPPFWWENLKRKESQ